MPETTPRGGAPTPQQLIDAADAVEDVVRLVDDGEVQATAPERAYLVGAAQTLRTLAGTAPGS